MIRTFKFEKFENNIARGEIIFKYKIEGETELAFSEKLILPDVTKSKIPPMLLENLLTSLHLVLGISYWKLYCPENIDLGNIRLNSEQASFWNVLYIKGLGEFFFKNNIDFRKFDLFRPNSHDFESVKFERKSRSLLPIGGGKDSIVSGELLKKQNKEFVGYTLGMSSVQGNIMDLMGIESRQASRIIDPQVFELNKQEGVYNGHIPISSIYLFTALLTAALFDFKYVVFSNEKSANYGNVEYLGEEINHQWSKSYEFEKMVQDYISKFITPDIIPFSLLRSMNEIKIVEDFCKYPQYFSTFSSCNTNFRINKQNSTSLWCGNCAKCLFMFICLAAFLPKDEVIKIFGQNLLENSNLEEKYLELLGARSHKPFDCVGTPDEVKLAFLLIHKKGEFEDCYVMKMFLKLFNNNLPQIEQSSAEILTISGENSIPAEFDSK